MNRTNPRIYKYPTRVWTWGTNGWSSRERTKEDREIARKAVADMTWLPLEQCVWNSRSNSVVATWL